MSDTAVRPGQTGTDVCEPALRVLQVTPRYLPDLGGIETHVHEIARRLHQRPGIEVTVLATDRSGSLPVSTVTEDGVPVLRRRAWPRERDYYVAPGIGKAIRAGGWDLVHVQGIHTAVPVLAMRAARRAGIPYVVTFHTGGHSSGLRNAMRGTQWKLLAPLLRDAAALIAVGRFEARTFEQATGLPAVRFRVIRNGGSLPPVPDGVTAIPGRVVSSGRLEEYKGHQRLIEALPLLRIRMPEAHLHILGSGPYEPELQAFARTLGVADAVTIRTILPGDRAGMARALREASVFATMSDYEAHPVAVMEALALGVPVVGRDVAGVGELVEDGVVVGVRDGASAPELAQRLLSVLHGEIVTRPPVLPTWESTAASLADLYNLVIAGR